MTIGYLIPLWLAPALQLALVLVMWKEPVFRRMFPAFFRYTCFGVVAGVLVLTAVHYSFWYFWVYWMTNIIYGVLALLVMREVFQTIWDMKRGVRRFTVWALMLASGAAATFWGMTHPDGHGRFAGMASTIDAFLAGVHTAEIILCCLVLWLAKKFNQYQIGIMLGFAASAIVAVVAYVGYYHAFSPAFMNVVQYAPVSAYMASAGVWLLTFLSRPKFAGKFDPEAAVELLRRQEELAQAMAASVKLKWPGDKRPENDNPSADATKGAPV